MKIEMEQDKFYFTVKKMPHENLIIGQTEWSSKYKEIRNECEGKKGYVP